MYSQSNGDVINEANQANREEENAAPEPPPENAENEDQNNEEAEGEEREENANNHGEVQAVGVQVQAQVQVAPGDMGAAGGLGFVIGGGLGAAHQALLLRDGPTGFLPYSRPRFFPVKVSEKVYVYCPTYQHGFINKKIVVIFLDCIVVDVHVLDPVCCQYFYFDCSW